MSDPENIHMNARENETFDRALRTALGSTEVKTALIRFPVQNPPDLRGAVESARADIWARVAKPHGRVRELEALREALKRRIADTDPRVKAASGPVEIELARLSNVWQTLSAEAERLRLEPEGYDPDAALAGLRRELGNAKIGERNTLAGQVPEPDPGSAGRASIRNWAWGQQERLTRIQLESGDQGPRAVVLKLAEIFLRMFGAGGDQTERVRRALTGLQRDLFSLEASLRAQQAAISEAFTMAANASTEYGTRTNELEEAWERLEEQLLNDGILDVLRHAINGFLIELYTLCMPAIDAPALSEPLASDKPVDTPAIETMRTLLERMHGASIGVAGPRGAGKSTLIDAFCASTVQRDSASREERSRPWLGIRVSAPVDYEPRDFILYLFAELCRRVAAPWAETEIQPPAVAGPADTRVFLRLCLAAVAVAGGVATAWGTVLVSTSLRAHPSLVRPVSGILAGILVFIAAAVLYNRELIIQAAPRPDSESYSRWYARYNQEIVADRRLYNEYVYIRRRRQMRLRVAGLGTLFFGAALAALAGWVSPAHASSYIVGAAAIAVSGPVAFIAISVQPVPRLATDQAPATWIAEYYRSGRDLRRVLNMLITGLAAMSFIFGVAAVCLSFTESAWSLPLLAGLFIVLVGGSALCAPLAIVGGRLYSGELPDPTYGTIENQETGDRFVRLAIESLIAIRFQQTVSSDWTGSVGLGGFGGFNFPIALQSQWSQGASWARQPQTYPELVGRFREFVSSITARHRVVIGIDELDKLESGVKAEQFLNDIKGIFGVRGCYFLVSVSEDAAASFDRRGLPFRDVFDTCFDTVVTVSYLDYASAKQLLYGRVIGWPMPFIALSYVMSGGLARDLIRVARLVISGEQQEVCLAPTARLLCVEEARARTRGLQTQLIRHVGDGPSDELLGLLADMPNDQDRGADPTTYLDRSKRLESWAAEKTAAAAAEAAAKAERVAEPVACRWARDLSALYLFLATVLEFFSDHLSRGDLETAENATQGVQGLDRLAAARQQMSVNTRLAVRYTEEFRAAWNLAPDPATAEVLS